MARKIKFPLEMKDGAKVRTLEELRENFSIERVIYYYSNGKLITWLKDRYYEVEAEKISKLDRNSSDFKRSLCDIIGVQFIEDELDIEDIETKSRRISYLKQFTDDEEIIKQIDKVAFNQEELEVLLNEGNSKIYLYGEGFNLNLNKSDIKYIGIKMPIVKIISDKDVDLDEKNIILVGIKLNVDNDIFVIAEKSENILFYDKNLNEYNNMDYKAYIKERETDEEEFKDLIYYSKSVKNIFISPPNGGDEKVLFKTPFNISTCCQYKNYIFYIIRKCRYYNIYRIKNNGKENVSLNIEFDGEDSLCEPYIINNDKWIVWRQSDGKLYKADLSGQNKEKVCYDECSLDNLFYIVSNNLFYIERNHINKLYKVNLDTNEKTLIGQSINLLIANDNNIYYQQDFKYEYGNPSHHSIFEIDLKSENNRLVYDSSKYFRRLEYRNKKLYGYYTNDIWFSEAKSKEYEEIINI